MKKQEIKPLSSYTQRHLKREKGITLIALVTTIVVLIILALIGINIAFKDDGALNSAEKSAEVQSNSTIKEQEEANTYVAEIENDNELKLAVTQKINSSPTSNNEYTQGDNIEYEVTITNTGEKNLVDLELTDKITRPDRTEGTPSGLPDGMKAIGRLGVGESTTLTYTHTVESRDLGGNLRNEVKVVGYAEDNPRENTEAVSRISVATQSSNPSLKIAKEVISKPAYGEAYIVGEEVKYQITVTNIGKATVSGIKIDDVLTAIDSKGNEELRKDWLFDTLYADKECTKSLGNSLGAGQVGYSEVYSYLVTQEDLGKTLSNNAEVKGKTRIPAGEKTPVAEKSGTLTITKAVQGSYGSELEYTFHAVLSVGGSALKSPAKIYLSNGSSYISSTGKIDFTLRNGESVNIVGLPDGCEYIVWEDSSKYNVVSSKVDTGVAYISTEKESYTGRFSLDDQETIILSCINRGVLYSYYDGDWSTSSDDYDNLPWNTEYEYRQYLLTNEGADEFPYYSNYMLSNPWGFCESEEEYVNRILEKYPGYVYEGNGIWITTRGLRTQITDGTTGYSDWYWETLEWLNSVSE